MSNLTKPVRFQGDRKIFPEDIDHIRTILRQFPGLSRKEVTETLCEHLNWLTPAGLPKTTACTKLLNRLEEQNIIRLPATQKRAGHPGLCAQSVPRKTGLPHEQAPLEMSLAELGPVRLAPVTEKAAQGLWNEFRTTPRENRAMSKPSRRAANGEITRPMFEDNLRLLFPQLETLPCLPIPCFGCCAASM